MLIKLKRILDYIESHSKTFGVLLFLFAFFYFSWLQFNTGLGDPDSYYHLKISQLIFELKSPVYNFPYLQFTTLKDYYIDHHLLYHLYLAPFIGYFGLFLGGKIGHTLLASLSIVAFYFLTKKLKIKYAFFLVLLLFLTPAYIFRINLIKAQPLSLIIVFLSTYFIIKRKLSALIALSFIYVWSYGGWAILPIIALTNIFSESLKELADFSRSSLAGFIKNIFSKRNIQLILAVLTGLALGIVINPYFPKNLPFYFDQVVQIGLFNYQSKIAVGAEWYPYGPLDFLIKIGVPFILFLLSLVLFFNYHKKLNKNTWFIFILSCLWLIATVKSRRNLEYFAPFALLLFGLLYTEAVNNPYIKNELAPIARNIKKYICDTKIHFYFLISIAIICCFLNIALIGEKIRASFNKDYREDYLKAESAVIKNNSEKDEIIFNTEWDDFPALFYHNTNNYYITGLDPTFMWLKNQEDYKKWDAIISNKLSGEEIKKELINTFKSRLIILETDRKELLLKLSEGPEFEKLFQSARFAIFKIK